LSVAWDILPLDRSYEGSVRHPRTCSAGEHFNRNRHTRRRMETSIVEISSLWKIGLRFEASGNSNVPVAMGSAAGESANTPMELLLMALAGCTGMDVISVLEKKRQPASSLEIRVRGTRADEHPRVYTDIEVEFVLRGDHLTEEAVARAIELSETKYCSVGGMLQKAVRIRTSFRILPPEAPHE
jgi:putative redox protein